MKNKLKLVIFSIILAPIVIGMFLAPKYGIFDFFQHQFNKPATAKAASTDIEYEKRASIKKSQGEVTTTGTLIGPIEQQKPVGPTEPVVCPAGQSGTPPNCQANDPKPQSTVGGTWKLVFSDEFNDSGLNTSKWATQRLSQPDKGAPYNTTLEDGYYTPNNTLLSSGNLELLLKKQQINGYQYSAGMAQTSPSFGFTYGYVEARIRVPTDANTLPAFWLTSNTSDLKQAPNIGISSFGNTANPKPVFEYNWLANNTPQSYVTEYGDSSVNYKNDYHVYGLLWQANKIQVYIDGKPGPAYTDKGTITSAKSYIVFNLAAKKGTTTATDTKMLVDYVRVWQ